MEGTPAGWYDDPEQPGQQRYWDGNAWTEQRAPGAATAPPAPPMAPPVAAPPKKGNKALWIILGILGGFFLLVLIAIAAVTFLGGDSATEALEKNLPNDLAADFADRGLEITITSAECEPVERKDGPYTTSCTLTIDGANRTLTGTVEGYITDNTLYYQSWDSPTNLVNEQLLTTTAQQVVDATEPGFEVTSCTLSSRIWVVEDGDTFDCTLDTGETVTFISNDNVITIDRVS